VRATEEPVPTPTGTVTCTPDRHPHGRGHADGRELGVGDRRQLGDELGHGLGDGDALTPRRTTRRSLAAGPRVTASARSRSRSSC
jgi:hypothetical protein